MSLLLKKDKYITRSKVNEYLDYSICKFNKVKNDSEEKLNDEPIATTYTLSENSLFFKQKFNNDSRKITEFYQLALESMLEELGIPKDKVINAIIHFDQTTPHLHFAISNIYPKYSKSLNREILTVNYQKSELIRNIVENKKSNEISWNQWLELKEQRKKYYREEISKSDWEAFRRNNYESGFLHEIEQRINNKYERTYEKGLYLSAEDKIYMENIRGFSNHDILEISRKRKQTEKYIKMQNNIVLKSRDTEITNELNTFRYKKPKLSNSKEQELIAQIQSNLDNEELFQKYINAKYNKQCGDFVLNTINLLTEEEKKQLCDSLGFNYEKEGNLALSKAILAANQMKALNEKALFNAWNLHEDYEWNTLIKDISNKDKAQLYAIFEMSKEMNVPKLNKIINNNFPINENTFTTEKCQKIIEEIRLLSFYASNPLEREEIRKANDKNYYYKKEEEWTSKRMNFFVNRELNKLNSKELEIELSAYEQRLMFKKVLQERIDFDLKSLNLYKLFEEKGLNSIERMREYNKVLGYCAHKQVERKQNYELAKEYIKNEWENIHDIVIDRTYRTNNEHKEQLESFLDMYDSYKKGAQYTPQDYVKELYQDEWKPINYELEVKSINEKELNEKEREIEIIKLENLKEIEYAVLGVNLTFEQAQEQYRKESFLEIGEFTFEDWENRYLEPYKENFKMELKMNSRELACDAREMNQWFEQKDLEEDLSMTMNNKWSDEEIEFYIAEIKTEISISELENEIDLEDNRTLTASGIDLEFIEQINQDRTMDLIRNINQNQNKEMNNDRNQEMNSMYMNYSPSISNRKYSSIMTNNREQIEISNGVKKWLFDLKLEEAIELAKKGQNIDSICAEINISPALIYKAVNNSRSKKREQNREIKQEIDDLSMDMRKGR